MRFIVYTDGACQPNPGVGGWAFLILNEDKKIIYKSSGFAEATTNNRMELLSVIKSFEWLGNIINATLERCDITVYSDSKYFVDGMSKWLRNWVSNLWMTSSKKPVKNDDMWKSLCYYNNKWHISCIHVKGHDGNTYNEMVDKLAVSAVGKVKQK